MFLSRQKRYIANCFLENCQGLLNLGSAREERLKRVTLQVDENDIVFALQVG
jgi:hypothetical protein